MKPVKATKINGIVLLALGLLSYLSGGENLMAIGLIPMGVGAVFLLLASKFETYEFVQHLIAVLSILMIILLLRPLLQQMAAGLVISTIRVGTMMFSCVVLLVVFAKSQMDKKKRGQWK